MLDTNTCSFIIREKPVQVLEKLQDMVRSGHVITISSITYMELYYAATIKKASPRHVVVVQEFVERIDEVMSFGASAVEHAANLREHLFSKGTPIGPNDTLIAGHALSAGATLITDNVREFSRVPELKVENWVFR